MHLQLMITLINYIQLYNVGNMDLHKNTERERVICHYNTCKALNEVVD